MSIITPLRKPRSTDNKLNPHQKDIGFAVMSEIAKNIHKDLPVKFGFDANVEPFDYDIQFLKIDYTFAGVLSFHYEGSDYLVHVIIEFSPGLKTIWDRTRANELRYIEREDLNTDFEKMASKHAIWLEKLGKDDQDHQKIILFDSWPTFPQVDRFPHHFHTYVNNEKSKEGFPFKGGVNITAEDIAQKLTKKIAS